MEADNQPTRDRDSTADQSPKSVTYDIRTPGNDFPVTRVELEFAEPGSLHDKILRREQTQVLLELLALADRRGFESSSPIDRKSKDSD